MTEQKQHRKADKYNSENGLVKLCEAIWADLEAEAGGIDVIDYILRENIGIITVLDSHRNQ